MGNLFQETLHRTYLLETKVLSDILKALKSNKYLDLGFMNHHIRVTAMDRDLLGYTAYNIPVLEATGPNKFVACNIENQLLLKTLDRFPEGTISLQLGVVQNVVKIQSQTDKKEYVLPCSFGVISGDMVQLDPARARQDSPEMSCTLSLRVFRELLKNLQAISVRAQLTFTSGDLGNSITIQSLSSQTHYQESIDDQKTKIQLQSVEGYTTKVVLLPGDINNLLRIFSREEITLSFYKEYLYLHNKDTGFQQVIILPLISSYYG